MPDALESLLPELRRALSQERRAVLSAAPGAGKSTILPLKLLQEPWLQEQRILLLEPRRIAAYGVAARLAHNLGEPLGQRVGYRMRFERRTSAATRLEVVTEGMLLRELQHDPALTGVGLVIFDEFHERSLASEAGLALTLDAVEALREDLRILVMSATMDCAKIAALLGGAPVLKSAGREFPVEKRLEPVRDCPDLRNCDCAVPMTRAILRIMAAEPGGVLAFFPGEPEIRRAAALLAAEIADPAVEIVPLYGRLDDAAQRRALEPPAPGRRRIVLATPVAESSLTISGVRIVVDSGLARIRRFDPGCGLSRLETVRISRAAADQRAGRAGRLEPGIAIRLWDAAAERAMPPARIGEITYADLAPLALELALWGVRDPAVLHWVEPPPEGAYAAAEKVLLELHAVDAAGKVTETGRKLWGFGAHPRLAAMMLAAEPLHAAALACDLAGLLEGGDWRGEASGDVEELLRKMPHEPRLANARKLAAEWRKKRGVAAAERSAISAGVLLALAFPERIARRRSDAVNAGYLLAGGRGAAWRTPLPIARSEWLVALDLEDRGATAELRLAATLTPEEVAQFFADRATTEIALKSSVQDRTLEAFEQRKLGAIVWSEKRVTDLDEAAILAAVAGFLKEQGGAVVEWGPGVQKLRERIAFVRKHLPESGFPDWSDAALFAAPETWLAGFLPRKFHRTILQEIDFSGALAAQLPHALRVKLEELAPERIPLDNGRSFRIDYAKDPPTLPVRIQQLFGCRRHPALLGGRLPLVLELLSPASRPVQITSDLPGFWKGSYQLVRKDLRGRYPKHAWPEDPLSIVVPDRS